MKVWNVVLFDVFVCILAALATTGAALWWVLKTHPPKPVLDHIASSTSAPPDQINDQTEAPQAELLEAQDATPIPMWRVSETGEVEWYNLAYEKLYLELLNKLPDPQQALFEIGDLELSRGTVRRINVKSQRDQRTRWFDLQRCNTESGAFFSAQLADAIVRAEDAQRNFVQTLAKTFAHLPTGLAIFDENRQLMLFNPALIELTGLGGDFLSSRPNLLSFFDELRNKRVMPEPKDYGSWRQQIAGLVAAAVDGRYSETWSLDAGRTYRVHGRPHPDGAVAFLLDDVSAEISLTRQFRAEIDLYQSTLDQLSASAIVIAANGNVALCSSEYCRQWGSDPKTTFIGSTILDCLNIWTAQAGNADMWIQVKESVVSPHNRTRWSQEISLPDAQKLRVDVIPFSSGATLILFEAVEALAHSLTVPEQQAAIAP